MRRECAASIEIAADPATIWAVVADVTRIGQWSAECRRCRWERGDRFVTPGARFRGYNRRGLLRWSRLNEVLSADPPVELTWRTLPSGPYPDSVQWRLDIDAKQAGSRVELSYRIVTIPKIMDWAVSMVVPAHRDRSEDLRADLERLRALVETHSGPS